MLSNQIPGFFDVNVILNQCPMFFALRYLPKKDIFKTTTVGWSWFGMPSYGQTCLNLSVGAFDKNI